MKPLPKFKMFLPSVTGCHTVLDRIQLAGYQLDNKLLEDSIGGVLLTANENAELHVVDPGVFSECNYPLLEQEQVDSLPIDANCIGTFVQKCRRMELENQHLQRELTSFREVLSRMGTASL